MIFICDMSFFLGWMTITILVTYFVPARDTTCILLKHAFHDKGSPERVTLWECYRLQAQVFYE